MSKQNDKQEVTRVDNVQHELPRVNTAPQGRVSETPDAFEVRLDLPGVEQKALNVSIEERTLTVEADSTVTPREGYKLVREEFAPARYRAMYEIPDRVDPSGIKASLSQGVLVLTLPKREEVKPRRIEISPG